MSLDTTNRLELRVTRTFDAPLEIVWRLWADTKLRARWWGPEGFSCVSLDQDFRPGGQWRVHIHSAEEGDLYASGVFREIEHHSHLSFTFRWDQRPGEEQESVASVSFKQLGGRTIQHFHQVPFQTIQSRDGHVGGWNSSFNRLASLAEITGGD